VLVPPDKLDIPAPPNAGQFVVLKVSAADEQNVLGEVIAYQGVPSLPRPYKLANAPRSAITTVIRQGRTL
jgi:hypothetical protein